MANGPFKMKNPALHSGARKGTPIQANYESPLKAKKGGQAPINEANTKIQTQVKKAGSDIKTGIDRSQKENW